MEGLGGGGVGDDPEIGGGGGPEPVDGDGIGDDGDTAKGGSDFWGKLGKKVRVDGKGEGDDLWAVALNELPQAAGSGAIGKKGIFNEGEVVASKVEKIPSAGVAVDEGKVKATKEIIQLRTGFGKRIGDDGGSATKFDRAGEAVGGGVMAIAKSGGENQDRRGLHMRPSRSNSSRRRSSA